MTLTSGVLVPSQEGCEDPQKNSWVVSSVFTVVTDNFMNSTGPGMELSLIHI